MWVPFAFWISLSAAVINVVLLAMIIKANIRKPGNLAAFSMFTAMLIWSVGELIERVAGPPPDSSLPYYGHLALTMGPHDANLAYIGAIILCFGIFLMPASIVHFSLDYPFRFRFKDVYRRIILYFMYGLSFIGMVLNILNDRLGYITVAYMKPYDAFGVMLWGLESGPVHAFFSLLLVISALVMVTALLLKLKKVDMEIVKNQIVITLLGFLVTIVLLVVTGLIPIVLERTDSYPLTTLAFSIFGITVLYTVVKYRLFLVVPTVEEKVENVELPEEGIHEMPKEEAYKKFVSLAKSAHTCLAFIPEDPEEFKNRVGLKNTPVFQFTRNLGKDRLNPELAEHRDMLVFIITSMVEQVYKPVILIDLSATWIGERVKEKIIDKINDLLKQDYGGVYFIVK